MKLHSIYVHYLSCTYSIFLPKVLEFHFLAYTPEVSLFKKSQKSKSNKILDSFDKSFPFIVSSNCTVEESFKKYAWTYVSADFSQIKQQDGYPRISFYVLRDKEILNNDLLLYWHLGIHMGETPFYTSQWDQYLLIQKHIFQASLHLLHPNPEAQMHRKPFPFPLPAKL